MEIRRLPGVRPGKKRETNWRKRPKGKGETTIVGGEKLKLMSTNLN